MRIATWCATALGAAALIPSAAATFTMTYTVLRADAWPSTSATMSGTAWSSPTASAVLYNNGTMVGAGTATGTYSTSTSSGAPVQATGGAARLGMDAMGFAAVAGLIGIVAF